MKDILYLELKDASKGVNALNDASEREDAYKLLWDTVNRFIKLSSIARREGLLALEMEADNLGDLHNGKYLSQLIKFIVDGTDPDMVSEIAELKYFASDFSDVERLQYLMMIVGCLSMQDGENPRVIEEKLKAFIPNELIEKWELEEEETSSKEKIDLSIVESKYDSSLTIRPDEPGYYVMKVTDTAIQSLNDWAVQRLLREISNNDLEVSMKGLSGAARERLFSNLSERLAVMIAEDMDYMGPVRMKDIVASTEKIFFELVKLADAGVIASSESESWIAFAKIFREASEYESEGQAAAETELMKVMREYTEKKNRLVE